MKKLFCLIALAVGFTSCNDEKHVWIIEDMFYFLDNGSTEGYVTPVTEMTAGPSTQVDLLVIRNGFAAERHPKQTVKVLVEESLSTAKVGTDFSLDQQVFDFQNENTLKLPLRVNIRNSSGKKIVLRLEYGYYDECRSDGRKADKLTIKVK